MCTNMVKTQRIVIERLVYDGSPGVETWLVIARILELDHYNISKGEKKQNSV